VLGWLLDSQMKAGEMSNGLVFSHERGSVMARYRDPLALGAEIGRLLKEAGWGQKDLAARLGIHDSSVSRLLNGQRGLGVDELYKVAEMFGVKAEAIVMEEEQELALLRTAVSENEDVARCLDAFDAAIQDYFAAKALARFL